MPLGIVESLVVGKRGEALCEDAVVVTDSFAAVIDGASDVSGALFDGRTGGRLAAETLAAAVERLEPDATCDDAVDALTLALAGAAGDDAGDRPAGSAVVYSAARREVWRVGDCSVLLDGALVPPHAPLDAVLLPLRQAFLHALVLEGATEEELRDADPDPAWPVLLPLLARRHVFRNLARAHPLAFGVLDGRPVPPRFRETIPVRDAAEVVLASDGYPLPLPTLAASERALAEELARDPLRIGRHPGFFPHRSAWASFDDRAYVRLRV